jgi:hypothetical protein
MRESIRTSQLLVHQEEIPTTLQADSLLRHPCEFGDYPARTRTLDGWDASLGNRMRDKIPTPEYTRLAARLEVLRAQRQAGVSYQLIASSVEQMKGEIHSLKDLIEREKLFGVCHVLLSRVGG